MSRCINYASNPMLTFLLYDIAMARQISAGLSIAERKGLGADIIESNKHYSESYWRVEQDLNCDVVRQMAALCDDANAETEKGKALYNWCHGETERRMEFPNFFITVSPSEWNFPIPAPLWNWIQANPSRISEVTGPLTLHIYNVLHTAMKADLF